MGNCHQHDRNYTISKRVKCDEFIIQLHRKQSESNTGNQFVSGSIAFDQRRLVFVSLIGLYQTFHLCPASRLYSAIVILPIKKEWIYDPLRLKQELEETVFNHHDLTTFKDNERFNEFLHLLQWKQSQNLLFCMLEQYEAGEIHEKAKAQECDALVAEFWIYFNEKLCNLYDPVTQSKYQALNFNDRYWRFAYKTSIGSKFNIKGYKILGELYFVTKIFKAIQAIIYESNPHSLNPIIAYNPLEFEHKIKDCAISKSSKSGFANIAKDDQFVDSEGFVAFRNGCQPDIDDDTHDTCSGNDGDEGIWMISTEYNEYDVE